MVTQVTLIVNHHKLCFLSHVYVVLLSQAFLVRGNRLWYTDNATSVQTSIRQHPFRSAEIYVTEFVKTNPNRTRTEIHFIA